MPEFQTIYEANKGDIKKLIQILSVDTKQDREPAEYRDEYNGERTRRAKSVGRRLPKTVNTYRYNEDTGEYIKTGQKSITPAKLVFNFPKKIVRTGAHFIAGGRMVVQATEPGEAFDFFKSHWSDKMKMQAVIKKAVRICKSQTKAAVIIDAVADNSESEEELKLKARVLDVDSGEFFPHFDEYGDMDAFIYIRKILNEEGKPIDTATVYTSDRLFNFENRGGWAPALEDPVKDNYFGKIPVVYVEQDKPDWEEVAPLIDAFETRVSRLSDTNDYFAEPLLKIWGNINKLPDKDEAGKVLNFDMKVDPASGKVEKGDAEYATWDHTPASIDLELKKVMEGIFAGVDVPNLSFESLQGVGNVAELTLKLMFMSSFIKRDEDMEIFGPFISRLVSVVNAGLQNIVNLKLKGSQELNGISVTFTDILPSDIRELIDTLTTATGGKPILSQETASQISPFTRQSDEEYEKIKREQKEGNTFNETFNI